MKERISYTENGKELIVEIKALLEEKQQKLLLVWIVLFTICGALLFSQLFADYEKSTLLFFGVYMAFWIFFEFKVIYAYRWRKLGLEQIILRGGELILVKEIGKRGITQKFKINDIKKVEYFNSGENTFFKAMNTSYWNINKYSLVFTVNEVKVPFAIDLDKVQSKELLKKINFFIKNHSS